MSSFLGYKSYNISMTIKAQAKQILYNIIRDYYLIMDIDDLEEEYIYEAINLVKNCSDMLSSHYTEVKIADNDSFDEAIRAGDFSLGEAVTNILYGVFKLVINRQNKGMISSKLERSILPLVKYLSSEDIDNFDVREKVRVMNLLS